MKKLKKSELINVQGGFNKSFWNGVCDGAIFAGVALLWAPGAGQAGGSLALGGISLLGCFNGPAK